LAGIGADASDKVAVGAASGSAFARPGSNAAGLLVGSPASVVASSAVAATGSVATGAVARGAFAAPLIAVQSVTIIRDSITGIVATAYLRDDLRLGDHGHSRITENGETKL
jgi:hypothetical protein